MGVGVSKGRIVAAIIGAVALSACAGLPQEGEVPAGVATTKIADGTTALPPPGFVGFCMQNLSACTSQKGTSASEIVLDDAARQKLADVNEDINHAIAYETDAEQYGIANVWTLNAVGGFGNCKDYALAKRQALIAQGFPESALRIAVVRMQDDELHAVLTVDTDHGDFVLDSVTPDIKPWSETNYRWLTRQSAEDPIHWVHVANNFADAQ